MTRIALAIILGAAGVASAQGRKEGSGNGGASGGGSSPPTGWYSDPVEKLFEMRLQMHKKMYPESAEQAVAVAKKYEAQFTAYREGIKDELAKHQAKRDELRKMGYSKDAREAWNAWFQKNRDLYAPVDKFANDFRDELTALKPGGAGGSTPAVAKTFTPVAPYTPPSYTPTPAPAVSEWATAEQVAALLGPDKLPPEPTRENLRLLADPVRSRIGSDPEAAAKLLKLTADFEAKLNSARESAGAVNYDNAKEALRIIRTHPSSVRVVDLPLIRNRWTSLVDPLAAVVREFEGELKKLEG